MGWIRAGGPQALQSLRDLKLRPARSDHGPKLQWESAVWRWFERLAQPRAEIRGLHVDRMAWLGLIQREGWDEDLAFDLLATVEGAFASEKPERGA